MGFNADLFDSACGAPFQRVLRAVAGLGKHDKKGECLMSSLPSELTFNALRDCARRHMKKERTVPANLHTAAARSIVQKNSGCKTLDVEPKDWAEPLPCGNKAALKATVHSAVRTTDVSLGVNCTGLTRQKTNVLYTKPHIWGQRLQLFGLLQDKWYETDGDDEAKGDAVDAAVKTLWIPRVLDEHLFVKVEGDFLADNHRLLVIAAGPNALRTLALQQTNPDDAEAYFTLTFKSYLKGCRDLLLPGIAQVKAPVVLGHVADPFLN